MFDMRQLFIKRSLIQKYHSKNMEVFVGVPLSQMWTVASYVIGKKLRGVKQYPLVLMLEPLFRCNLSCAGCGKIQHPTEILRKNLTPEQCFHAVDECGAPIVSIP
ncbi:Radical SAM protein required for addition of adenosine to hopane skeleton, HpnH, partial [hydrothermal vent metagenome]